MDETGGRPGRERAWLWVAVTTWVTVCVVRLSRGSQGARELWGAACDGMVVSDRFSAYHWDPVRWRQRCWAHLRRAIEAMCARGGHAQEIGTSLQALARQMFHWWHRVRDGTLKRSSFRSSMSPLRRECIRVLEAGRRGGVAKTAGVCREMLKRPEALWPFGHLDGVEPTTNASERAIRPGVLWRKSRFGTHSAEGARFVEAIMTVVATLKQQPRTALEYLTAACEATRCDKTAPSFLPTCVAERRAAA